MDQSEAERKYNQLAGRLRVFLQADKEYLKNTKDYEKLKKVKALKTELDSLVNGTPSTQAKINWLAQ